jgi:hypothetical protein
MSGLEAIYWAQKYPDEVIAIIGLDPTTPGSIEVLPDIIADEAKLFLEQLK